MLTIAPTTTHTLVRGHAQYDFVAAADTTTIVKHTRFAREQYTMPTSEARLLWKRLRKQGYERF